MSEALAYDIPDWIQAEDASLGFESLGKADSAKICTISSGKNIGADETRHPVWSININGEYEDLSKPLVLIVRKEGLHYFAENDALDVSGFGSKPGEAIADAINDIVHYYQHYSSLSDDDVIGYGVELKQRYMGLFAG